MRAFLIGHRGTGKSTFLKLLSQALPEVPCFDLDKMIELGEGRKIPALFRESGESAFRTLEKKYFSDLLKKYPAPQPLIVALGAGFDSQLVPEGESVWLGRRSDLAGRIFLDRPALTALPTHPRETLGDYFSRFSARNAGYARSARTKILWGQEGRPSRWEISVFKGDYDLAGASLTLTPDLFLLGDAQLKKYFDRYLARGILFLEVRNDLLSYEQALRASQMIPAKNFLVSFRANEAWENFLALPGTHDWDADLLTSLPAGRVTSVQILSSHNGIPPMVATSEILLKWAPVLSSWEELEKGLAWQRENPEQRSFLPRSLPTQLEARWIWLRLLLKAQQKINFIKERVYTNNEETLLKNADQPTLVEWIAWNSKHQQFAALLGDPALHSWSPAVHREFFDKMEMNFVSVPISAPELDRALRILKTLGLRAAAVTSPHKNQLFLLADHRHLSTHAFESANTLWIDRQGESHVFNTDSLGAEFLLRGLEQKSCAVIGGGGTLPILKKLLPHASFYSARSLELTSGVERGHYDLVIWAAGGHVRDLPENYLPPSCQTPKFFLDLDYRENSTGRAVAQFLKSRPNQPALRYLPGHKMFLKQAKSQQELWSTL